jgi:hypothetical protein
MSLDASWIEKLRALPVYTPSSETLALRAAMPSPGDLPAMTIQELAKHDGQSDQHSDKTIYTSVCGFIFEHKACCKWRAPGQRCSALQPAQQLTWAPLAGGVRELPRPRRDLPQCATLSRYSRSSTSKCL